MSIHFQKINNKDDKHMNPAKWKKDTERALIVPEETDPPERIRQVSLVQANLLFQTKMKATRSQGKVSPSKTPIAT